MYKIPAALAMCNFELSPGIIPKITRVDKKAVLSAGDIQLVTLSSGFGVPRYNEDHFDLVDSLYIFTSNVTLCLSKKATLVSHRRFVAFSRTGKPVFVIMEFFQIHGKSAAHQPEGYRVGWIAFDPECPEKRVLFDSHPPKGIHFHIDGDNAGISFDLKSLPRSEQMFFDMVCRHFNIDEKELS